MSTYLAISRCPTHREFWAVMVEDEDGRGTRVTPSKCCGRWETVKRWKLDERMANEIIDEVSSAQSSTEGRSND